ncbi:hypothetical protein H5407_09335 [Mitsuaria sp. WAJ17]|uniref:hypothetical protein n=1 Tax=Mitsuaria sp. WAJ17 TaxID=2761452 RepID=UPI001602E9D2|nr:hypothetical protein [Mitsuaria sp. WAJ17]MBB2485429.1 hypothetical protein [Mitsuaria sp. WAJ17]
MSARHTADTRRIQLRLQRLELRHLRGVVSEQGERLAEQDQLIADLQRRLADAEDALDYRWQQTIELGERMEAEGTGRLGLSIDGTLCVLTNTHAGVQQ